VIHRSKVVAAYLDEYYINTIRCPAYSPNQNPIEPLWYALRRRTFKRSPQYNNYSVAAEEWEGFCEVLKECRSNIPRKHIKRLILSMPQRLAAVSPGHFTCHVVYPLTNQPTTPCIYPASATAEHINTYNNLHHLHYHPPPAYSCSKKSSGVANES
jgi:hypothetical protein